MKQKIKNLLQDKIVINNLIALIIISILYLIITFWKWKQLPPQIPIFYSLPKGIDQLGSSILFLIIPLLSFIIFLVNYFIAVILYPTEKLASIIFVGVGTLTICLLFITYLKIIFLIT